MYEEKIIKITRDDAVYPALLRQIKKPPGELWCIGDLKLLQTRCVSIVGSRKVTGYGIWAAEKLADRAASAGLTVVSGLAVGIDTAAHKGALRGGGKTVAVVGTGVDVCYPAANRDLRRKICAEGLLISEYPPGHPTRKYNFPERNRIISGLSEATVVAEAGLNSGALITASLAAEQGRCVYAIPGNINSICSIGSNRLLADGAMPLVVLDDLLSDLGVKGRDQLCAEWALGKDEKVIYEAVADGGEMTADDLCGRLGRSSAEINGIVTILEMKGLLCTALGKIFIAK